MANLDKRRAYEKSYYVWNADKMRAKQRAWKKRNSTICRMFKQLRRERERRVEQCDSISANALAQIIESLPKMRCSICRRNMRQGDRTIDHIIPLSKGGTGHIGNLQVVHRACNSRKKSKFPHELDGQQQIHFVGDVAA